MYTAASGKSLVLAQELATAARSKMMRDSMPARVPALAPFSTQFWQDMINGTGDAYYVYPENDTSVNVFDYKQCAEVSKNQAWILI